MHRAALAITTGLIAMSVDVAVAAADVPPRAPSEILRRNGTTIAIGLSVLAVVGFVVVLLVRRSRAARRPPADS